MTPRDQRAVAILLLWGTGVGLYFAGQSAYRFRQDWKAEKVRLGFLDTRKRVLDQVLASGIKERAGYADAFPKEWRDLPPDQLRLKGQNGLLAAVQQSGLGGIRIRAEVQEEATATGHQLGWTLEGEGTLMQWVKAFDAIEKSQPFMRVQAFHVEMIGDPWHPAPQGEDGPPLKGSVKCTWTTGL